MPQGGGSLAVGLQCVPGIHVLGTASSKAAPFSVSDVPVPVGGTALVARICCFRLCATF